MTSAIAAPSFMTEGLTALLRGEDVYWQSLRVTSDQFLDACAIQDVTGLVHQRLCGRLEHGWPHTLCDDLAQAVRVEAAKELLRRKELMAVLDTLAHVCVRPILLKGTPLAYSVYETPTSRPRHDTDVLVPRNTLDAVRSAMVELGYMVANDCDGEFLFRQFMLTRQDAYGVEHAFDFHWKISTQSVFADLLTYDELADEAVPVPALGPYARAAGPLHALLLACIHPVMHHQNVEWLIWVYDIHLLASRLGAADLERFADLALAKRVGAICAHELTIAQARLGTRIPEWLITTLAAVGHQEVSAAYLRPGRRWHHELAASVRGLRRWKDRLRLVREVLLPSPRYLRRAYGFTTPTSVSVLLPALYVHRVVRGVWKVIVGRK